MSTTTFRDFAAVIMQGKIDEGGAILQALLGLEAGPAIAAAGHFAGKMNEEGNAFMMKAMGLRNATESGDQTAMAKLLTELFGLPEEAAKAAVLTLTAAQ